MHFAATCLVSFWLNLAPALTPVAILPQNQYSGGCPSRCDCADQCEADKEYYCWPSCSGKTGTAYNDCMNQCAVTFNACYSWCANNCPGDFGPTC